MKRLNVVLFALLAILPLAVLAEGATPAPPNFKFTTMNVPGSISTQLFGINNSGSIVGDYADSAGIWHGVLISGGKNKTIDHPSAVVGTFLYSINSTGTIAGFYQDGVGGYHGFTYKAGVFTAINPAGSTLTTVYGVNDSGVVTGSYVDGSNVRHGFYGSPTKGYTILDVPGSTSTLGYGINKAGNLTLVWQDSSGLRHGSLYTVATKKFLTLNVPGSTETPLREIDTAGDIVTLYVDAAGTHSALRIGGKYFKFSDPVQPNNTRATGINDKRMLVGNLVDVSGNVSGMKVTY